VNFESPADDQRCSNCLWVHQEFEATLASHLSSGFQMIEEKSLRAGVQSRLNENWVARTNEGQQQGLDGEEDLMGQSEGVRLVVEYLEEVQLVVDHLEEVRLVVEHSEEAHFVRDYLGESPVGDHSAEDHSAEDYF